MTSEGTPAGDRQQNQPKLLEIPIECGPRWTALTEGMPLPEHEITRIKTYLAGMNADDLVYTDWYDAVRRDYQHQHSTRLVVVGEDGAGRRLRRNEYDVEYGSLLDDVASIYFCVAGNANGDDGADLRYVLIDCGDGDKPTLVCRRSDFGAIFVALQAGGNCGNVWMGKRSVDASEWESLDEDGYLFENDLIATIHDSTSGFLGSHDARALKAWGVAARRGVLLHGPPGNGKTVLSRIAAKRAIAEGVNVVFLTVDTLARGLGSSLRLAASRSPVLIVIDDIDVHCGRRASDSDGYVPSQARQRFLADLLEFLDGVSVNDGYALLATTNELDELDPALRRAGRLDVHIKVTGPPESHRRKLLEDSMVSPGLSVPDVSGAVATMAGCSYADIAELVRRYKIAVVAKYGQPAVDQTLLEQAASRFAQEIGILDVIESGPTLT